MKTDKRVFKFAAWAGMMNLVLMPFVFIQLSGWMTKTLQGLASVTALVMTYGFYRLAEDTKNKLLKKACIAMIIVGILFTVVGLTANMEFELGEGIAFNPPSLTGFALYVLGLIALSITGIVFGAALMRIKLKLSKPAGILEITSGLGWLMTALSLGSHILRNDAFLSILPEAIGKIALVLGLIVFIPALLAQLPALLIAAGTAIASAILQIIILLRLSR